MIGGQRQKWCLTLEFRGARRASLWNDLLGVFERNGMENSWLKKLVVMLTVVAISLAGCLGFAWEARYKAGWNEGFGIGRNSR